VAIDIVVPQIGEAVSELQIVAWHKQVGDAVKRGEVLFEVDSDKAIVEVEAFVDGTLVEIIHGDGSAVLPQQIVARIATADEGEDAAVEPSAPLAAAPETAPAPPDGKASPLAQRVADDLGVDVSRVTGTGPSGRVTVEDVRQHAARSAAAVPSPTTGVVVISPKARRIARERGLDLDGLSGTGVDGMIVVRDLEALAPSAAAALPAADGVVALSKLRQVTAERTLASKQGVPHFYLMVDVDMSEADSLRAYCREQLGWERPPTYTDLLARACALAVAAMPEVNRSYSDGKLLARGAVGLGIAINTPNGLVAPSIPNADALDLRALSTAIRELAARARDGRLRPTDVGAKSMVISNLGMYGVDQFIAIIDQPDPMILAVGRVTERVVPVRGQIVIQPMCTLTLSVDHRVLDGVQGAQFLDRVKAHLEHPFQLLGSDA